MSPGDWTAGPVGRDDWAHLATPMRRLGDAVVCGPTGHTLERLKLILRWSTRGQSGWPPKVCSAWPRMRDELMTALLPNVQDGATFVRDELMPLQRTREQDGLPHLAEA